MGKPSPHTKDNAWLSVQIDSVEKAFDILAELKSKNWICRGQPKEYEKIISPIDRYPFSTMNRKQKLRLEQRSMQMFRTSIKYFNEGENECLRLDIPTLMLMQHHQIPTRLVDWSASPYVAAFFACNEYHHDTDLANGEIWGFDYDQYYQKAEEVWVSYTETHKRHKSSPEFDNEMPAIFTTEGAKEYWFILQFLHGSLTRLSEQKGLFSVISWFGYDHALALQDLLEDRKQFCRYVIKKEIKMELIKRLASDFGIWQGSLFPDSSGVSEAINRSIFSRMTNREDKFSL